MLGFKALIGSDAFPRGLRRERTATRTSEGGDGAGARNNQKNWPSTASCAVPFPEGRAANGMGSGELVAMATAVSFQLFRIRKSYSSPVMVQI